MSQRDRERGFTFIELLISLAILGVLAMAMSPMLQVVQRRQKEHELRVALVQLREAIDAYKRASEQGRVPLRLGESGYPPSLNVLVEGVVDQHSPVRQRLYFLRRMPRDPFATSPPEPAADGWGLRAYESPPDDPRSGRDVFDVYSRSTETGLNGIPYRQW